MAVGILKAGGLRLAELQVWGERSVVIVQVTHAVTHVGVAAQRKSLEQDTAVEGNAVQIDFLLNVLDRLTGEDLVRGLLDIVDGGVPDDGHIREMYRYHEMEQPGEL